MNEDPSSHPVDGPAPHHGRQRDGSFTVRLTVQPLRRGEQVILAGEAFRLWLRLDLGDSLRRGRALDYVATVSAHRLRDGPRQLLGEARGRLSGDGDRSVAVEVPSTGLPAGSYGVEAAVALLDPASARPLESGAFVEGMVLHAVPAPG